jgi:hypothetical protein
VPQKGAEHGSQDATGKRAQLVADAQLVSQPENRPGRAEPEVQGRGERGSQEKPHGNPEERYEHHALLNDRSRWKLRPSELLFCSVRQLVTRHTTVRDGDGGIRSRKGMQSPYQASPFHPNGGGLQRGC